MRDLPLIRIATAGSVDDGKSTLIGRLLVETNSLFEDQIDALRAATERRGEGGLNLALVTDGLRAEREQNITIDVAYRPFHSEKRRYLLADSPGHAQYTRNMVTAASTAHVVLVLCDAFRGLTVQSRRHLAVAALLGVPRIVLVINKIDLVEYDQVAYNQIVNDLTAYGQSLGAKQIDAVPVSALLGDNVVAKSDKTPWYAGRSLLEYLDHCEIEVQEGGAACLPVQNVLLGSGQARFFTGTLRGQTLKVGDEVNVSGEHPTKIKSILVGGSEADKADPGQPIAVQLTDEIDVARGDLISIPSEAEQIGSTIKATLFWMHSEPLRVGMNYKFVQGPRSVVGRVTAIESQLDIESGERKITGSLALNDIGYVSIELGRPAPLHLFSADRELGSFILIDPSAMTVAAGRIDLVSAGKIQPLLAGRAPVIWLTGLSGAGKSTIAKALVDSLKARGILAVHLDGDDLRTGLCSDLAFSAEDRIENVRRVSEVARLFSNNGAVTICSLISPLIAHREIGRQVLGDAFLEVYVKCGIEECMRRDPKGLYQRVKSGAIKNFTGVDAPYEAPVHPALVVDTEHMDVDSAIQALTALAEARVL